MTPKSFEEILNEQGVLCWRNTGVSMLPLLREGRDLMVIEKRGGGALKKYDAVLYTRSNPAGKNDYVLHRILKCNPDGSFWIVGDNCVSGENVTEESILGVLTSIIRDGKTIKTTNVLYQLYVHIWCDIYPLRFIILRFLRLVKRAGKKFKRKVTSGNTGNRKGEKNEN